MLRRTDCFRALVVTSYNEARSRSSITLSPRTKKIAFSIRSTGTLTSDSSLVLFGFNCVLTEGYVPDSTLESNWNPLFPRYGGEERRVCSMPGFLHKWVLEENLTQQSPTLDGSAFS